MIIGVGMMGQHMATHVIDWLGLRKLVLLDYSTSITVGTEKTALADFATTEYENHQSRSAFRSAARRPLQLVG